MDHEVSYTWVSFFTGLYVRSILIIVELRTNLWSTHVPLHPAELLSWNMAEVYLSPAWNGSIFYVLPVPGVSNPSGP